MIEGSEWAEPALAWEQTKIIFSLLVQRSGRRMGVRFWQCQLSPLRRKLAGTISEWNDIQVPKDQIPIRSRRFRKGQVDELFLEPINRSGPPIPRLRCRSPGDS